MCDAPKTKEVLESAVRFGAYWCAGCNRTHKAEVSERLLLAGELARDYPHEFTLDQLLAQVWRPAGSPFDD